MSNEALSTDAEHLARRLAGLDDTERLLLAVLAVLYSETTRTELVLVLVALGSKTPARKSWDSKRIVPFVERLTRAGVLHKQGLRCAPELRGVLTRALVERGEFERVAAAVESAVPGASEHVGTFSWRSVEQAVRPVRNAFYRGDVAGTVAAWKRARATASCRPMAMILEEFASFEPLERFAPALLTLLGHELLTSAPHEHAALRNAVRPRLEARLRAADDHTLRCALANELVWCGRIAEADALLRGLPGVDAEALRARAALLRGCPAEALASWELVRTERLRGPGVLVGPALKGIDQLFYLSTLLALGDAESLGKILTQGAAEHDVNQHVLRCLQVAAAYLAKGTSAVFSEESWRPLLIGADLRALFEGLARRWTHTPVPEALSKRLESLAATAASAGHAWIEFEARALCPGAEALPARPELPSLAGAVRTPELWRKKLDALALVDVSSGREEGRDPRSLEFDARLAWMLTLRDNGTVRELAPREQKRSGKGWTGGRPVALQRLYGRLVAFPHATEQDRRVLSHLEQHTSRGYGYAETWYGFVMEPALEALVGHPALYLESATSPVELRRGEPRLYVEPHEDEGALALRMDPATKEGYAIRRAGPEVLELVRLTAPQRRIAELLEGGLRVPIGEENQLQSVVEHLAGSVAVHSAREGFGATTVLADATLRVQFAPYRAGLRVSLAVRPLGAEGPAFTPGAGASSVAAPRAGVVVRANRTLDEERARMEEFVRACPSLARGAYDGDHWRFEDVAPSLELLSEVAALGDRVVPEWPRATPLWQLATPGRNAFSLRLRAASGGGLLEATGALELAPGHRVELAALFTLLESSPGRFLELGEGRFVALAETFAQRLRMLQRVATVKGDALQVHPLHAQLLSELAEEAEKARLDKDFRALVQRRTDAEARAPEVPGTLQAELRDYQADGFRWLGRLSMWASGACLADDMGVGKTLQVLALLLLRAKDGPALVLAPTSVCGHWVAEALRFAPSLTVRRFGVGDREAALREAGPGTVLVVSYGLLQSEHERLTAVSWHTLVFDEAQQLKNSATLRFKAAAGLRAAFRVSCTGTPVENHLGDLWSQLQLTNPGLVSTLPEFRRRFLDPIEKEHSGPARAQLRQLLRPFVLRRTKAEVLGELPPRTEVTLRVELEPEESALYEHLRERAVRSLAGAAGQGPGARMRVLAQLMRLRQAACNARLVLGDEVKEAPASAKLAAFGELVESLRGGGHRALVFSQFVTHLALVRAWLDARKITYQYLDGSTPAQERDRCVRAFQAGEGELFLCSLRAGGTGLNLTAADYVVHLDPWWNPAVEDQASDRAHRLGQRRPVTVYRLVARDTIEEKILALHAAKRELSMGLLEGDADASLSVDELLALLEPLRANE